jgi:hypothetical protein
MSPYFGMPLIAAKPRLPANRVDALNLRKFAGAIFA